MEANLADGSVRTLEQITVRNILLLNVPNPAATFKAEIQR